MPFKTLFISLCLPCRRPSSLVDSMRGGQGEMRIVKMRRLCLWRRRSYLFRIFHPTPPPTFWRWKPDKNDLRWKRVGGHFDYSDSSGSGTRKAHFQLYHLWCTPLNRTRDGGSITSWRERGRETISIDCRKSGASDTQSNIYATLKTHQVMIIKDKIK